MRSRGAAVCLFLLSGAGLAHAGGGPENVLVLVNDLSAESLEIGRYYIHRRRVPRHHLVHVRIPGQPPVEPGGAGPFRPLDTFPGGYAGYRKLLEEPVRAWLRANPDAPITTIVLTRGIPAATPLAKGEEVRSTTHMLSMLALGSDTYPTQDAQLSPFWKAASIASLDPSEPFEKDGRSFPLYAVGMLSGFTAADAKRSIDLAIEADEQPRQGTFYLQHSASGDPRGCHNPSYPKVAAALAGTGVPVKTVAHPAKASLLEGRTDIAFYAFGEALWDVHFPGKNKYLPGAVVDNITSWGLGPGAFVKGAQTYQTPMPLFLSAGATAVHGCVFEPTTAAWHPEYLHLTLHASGFNLIESYMLSHPLFPWMNLVVGDPLLQPYARRPRVTLDSLEDGRLRASAVPAPGGGAVRKLRLFVDGRLVREVPGASGEFVLNGFEDGVNDWTVVAVEDGPRRTQGALRGGGPKRAALRASARIGSASRNKVTVLVSAAGNTPVFSWHAPGADVPVGRKKGGAVTLTYPSLEAGRTVDVWVENAKAEPRSFLLEVPGAGR